MKYFESGEIIFSIISFLLLGIFCGGLYHSFNLVFVFIKELISSPKRAYIKYRNKIKTKKILEQNVYKNSILLQITDFAFILFAGILYIIFLYIFLDGTFRFYSLLFLGAGYLFSLNSLDKFFSLFLRKSFKLILVIFDFLLYIFLCPLFYLSGIIKRISMPIITFIVLKYEKKRTNSLFKHKKREVQNFLNSLPLFLIISTYLM